MKEDLNMKKPLTLLLCVSMVCALTACGNAKVPESADSQGKDSQTSEAQTSDAKDALSAVSHEEPVTLKIAYDKLAFEPVADCLLDEALLDKFNIIAEWEDIEDADFSTNVTLQMAGTDYPDIIWHCSSALAQELSLTGHLLDVDSLEEGLPDFIQVFDEGVEGGWDYVKDMLGAADGKLYFLPAKNPRLTAKCWHIRAGSMIKMGLIDSVEDLPTTVDGLVSLLEAIKEKDPDSIPFMVQGWGNVWDGWNYAYNVRDTFYQDYFSGEFIPYGPATDNWRNMLITLNYLYENKLIAEDYLTITEDETIANTIDGMYYAEFNWAGSHTNAMNERNSQTDPDCGWIYYLNMPAADDSKHLYDRETAYKSQGMVLTDKLEGDRLARVLEFFNWTATDEGGAFLSWGKEGVTYTVDDEGNKVYTELIMDYDHSTAPAVQLHAYTRYQQDFIPNRNIDAVIAVSGPVNIDLGNSFEAQGYGYFKDLNFKFDIETQEEINMLKTLLTDTMTDYSNQFVMGMLDPESDADWQTYLDALDSCGLQEWNDYYVNYYNENLK